MSDGPLSEATPPPAAPRKPVVLVILDGFGVNPGRLNNAIAEAHTPNLDAYFARHPHTLLQASGPAVGLPDGQMGNSEVGHLTLGAGSVIRQDSVRIDDAIANGEFHANPALVAAMEQAQATGRPVHLMGLVSDGGVHSDLGHLLALVRMAADRGVRPLLHMFTDGRDTPPHSAQEYLDEVLPALERAGGAVASIMGRYYAMDRDRRWERTERAWRALMLGKGRHAHGAREGIDEAYAAGETDEFIKPVLLPGFQAIAEGDPVVFFNFRKDRPRQLVAALADPGFGGFDRGEFNTRTVTCMMPYDRSLDVPFAFEPERPVTTLGEVVSAAGLRQFHTAETEKYAHVTYFLNGGRSEPYPGETQHLVPSPTVATYDLAPEMSAYQVAAAVVGAIESREYGLVLVNFANGDMVGHTAVRDAVVQAVEVLDDVMGWVLDAAAKHDHAVLLTADHGNCEEIVDPTNDEPQTQHTAYPVPCLVVDEVTWKLSCSGGLADVAPTVLTLMGLEVPREMSGKSLLLKPLNREPKLRSLRSAA